MKKILLKKKILLILIFFAGVILFGGCAGAPAYLSDNIVFSPSEYMDIDEFCKKNNFQHDFDTIDDLVTIYSQEKEIKVLLNSFVGAVNGSIFYLKRPPLYREGKILIPKQLDSFMAQRQLSSFKPSFSIKTIVIDPGHGGKDPGAISPRGIREKTINLQVAKYLKAELEARGFRVVLTRTGDVFIPLQERAEIAKRNDADLFVSLHANANRSRSINGVEIYRLSDSKLNSRDRSLRLAKSDSFRGRNFTSTVETILWDLQIEKNYAFSVEISNILYLTFKNLGFKVSAPKEAGFHVLRYAYVPSVLVEMGYLTNSYEEKALSKNYYQKQIAQAVSLAVDSLNKRYSGKARRSNYANLDW